MSRDDKVTPIRGTLSQPAVAAAGDAPPSPPEPPPGPLPSGSPPTRQPGEIWPGCPVIALGIDGKWFYYLDALGQLQSVDNHTLDRMRGIFGGRVDLLKRYFPRWSVPREGGSSEVIGWVQADCAAAMQLACAEKGIFKPHEKLRGVGAWPDGRGGVLLHCGDRILVKDEDGKDQILSPGEIDGYIYTADAPGPRPADCTDAEGRAAAEELRAVLGSWNWSQPELEPHLALGWIAAATVGGALDWRPTIWSTGDRGTGKSTLDKLLSAVLGGEQGLLTTTDATEAGLRSQLRHSTVPVVIDEAEAEADNRKMNGLVKLARAAASGGMTLRGSADHVGAEFRVRSPFWLNSILMPPLGDQDISRIAVLELQPLKHGAVPPQLNPAHWRAIGSRIRRRVFDAWPRLHTTLELYRQALTREGHSARGADQYGTLLALADLVLWGGDPDSDTLAGWAGMLGAAKVHASSDESHDWQRMVTHLFSQRADVYRSGVQHSVGEIVAAAADLPTTADSYGVQEANRHLARMGMRVEGTGWGASLALANQHAGLEKLFQDKKWAGGVWRQSARRIPGATAPPTVRTLAMARTRVTLIPLDTLREWLDQSVDLPSPAARALEDIPL